MDSNGRAPVAADSRLARAIDCYTRGSNESDSIRFMPRELVLTTLPHSRPATNTFVRVNGNLKVSMVAAGLGLPYGIYPRRILVSIASEAVRTQSNVIHLGHSLSGYLRTLGLKVSGGQHGPLRHLKEQARRLFSTFVSIEEEGGRSIRIRNVAPIEEAYVWWEPQIMDGDEPWEAQIVLNQKFFQQIIDAPVPLDWRVIQSLRSPLAIDVYIWASYRRGKAKSPSLIPWRLLQAQFGAGYSLTPGGRCAFKRRFAEVIGVVAIYDPEIIRCLLPQDDGLLVRPGRHHVPRADAWG